MPDDPLVWIVAIIVAAIVLLFALWKGDIVEFTTDPLSLKFKRERSVEKGGAPGDRGAISVGEGLSVRNSKTGDIVGVKTEGAAVGQRPEDAHGGSIDVGRNASIENSETGDIAGVKKGGSER